MKDITSRRVIVLKGGLFVLGGLLAAGVLLLHSPTLKTALLLAAAVWCFARAYYFAFYVVQHYVDPSYRFSGLWSFAAFMARRRRGKDTGPNGA